MTNCGFDDKIAAYHDGELDASLRASVEMHLAECEACRQQLNQLRAMSGLMAAGQQPRFSQISRYRLHQKVDAAMEQGLLRLAWMMSGIAASVLLLGSVWLLKANDNSAIAQEPAEAPPWVSVSLASSRDPVVRDAASPAAQWYLADATGSEGMDNR
jgi:anti-sigma factor RsiW